MMRIPAGFILGIALAVQADWPCFLGATRDGKSAETGLNPDLTTASVRWSHPRGESYSAPSIRCGRLVLHGRFQGLEKVDCLDAATGTLLWSNETPTTYTDRFRYLSGPRATPAIDGERVYTLGAQGVLSCLRLVDGALLWRRSLRDEFGVGEDFFGFCSSPLVEGDSLILNLGAGTCVVALDKFSGATRWIADDPWGRSYATPVAATVHGQRVLFVFAGGESSPPSGGLLCLDAVTGRIFSRFPWRSPRYSSVNASTPVVSGTRVFVSSSYDVGGVMLDVQPDFTLKEIYRTKAYASHWATPILHNGYLYGFANNKLTCMDWATGTRVWREVIKIDADAPDVEGGSGRGADLYREPPGNAGFGIGSLIYSDGKFLCLGENGLLAWLDLSPDGVRILSSVRLFHAEQAWTAPVLSDGRAYLCQNLPDAENPPRLICVDLVARED
jgi:outer membrane protein assembly factor BamB